MSKILIRSGKDPFQVLSPETASVGYSKGVWGSNVGNLIFSDTVHKIISTPGTEVVSNNFLSERPGINDHYIGRINEEFDHFVIPLANAFRTSFMAHLNRLTQVIEGMKIPVTVVGVGVAGGSGSLKTLYPKLKDDERQSVDRFLRAVLDRSASIGVRGEFTRSFLSELGYGDEHVDVIGCPSLFRRGRDLTISKKVAEITPDSQFTMNLTPYVKQMADASVRHAERYPRMVYIPQGHETIELMMWGTPPASIPDPAMPTHIDHPLYQQDRIRFFIDSSTWINYLSTQDFSWGTRIHGNIAALIARTPAFVLAHDSRTLELAQYHDIPHRQVPDLSADFDAADLHTEADFTKFNAGHAKRFDLFTDFLAKNRIENIFTPGNENPEYDQKLAATEFAPAVSTLYSTDPEEQRRAINRIAELRSRVTTSAWRSADPQKFAVPHKAPKDKRPAAKSKPADLSFLKRVQRKIHHLSAPTQK